MSNRVNTLMELLQHLQQSIELHSYSMTEQTTEEPRDTTVNRFTVTGRTVHDRHRCIPKRSREAPHFEEQF